MLYVGFDLTFVDQVSCVFIQHCIANNIDTVVIGYNEGWKQNINIGKRNNQNFVEIPFLNLLKKIEYKAEDYGIRVIRHVLFKVYADATYK